MHKSSIYLPDDLKHSLARRAAASGRSEAELIRHAIEHLLSAATRGPGVATDAEVALDTVRPQVIGVGMGPGDPGLVTRRAVALVGAADRVLVATTDTRSIGRAEMVVRAVAPLARVQRVAYAIGAGDDRAGSMERLVEAVLAGVDAGELVAVAVLGDPSQWTVFPELARRVRALRPGLPVSATAGIAGYQAAAAEASFALGEGLSTLVITADPRRAREAIAAGDAVVLYKATTDGAAVRELIAGTGRDDAIVAELTGVPGESARPVARIPDGPLAYLSTVIVPHHDRRRPRRRVAG